MGALDLTRGALKRLRTTEKDDTWAKEEDLVSSVQVPLNVPCE